MMCRVRHLTCATQIPTNDLRKTVPTITAVVLPLVEQERYTSLVKEVLKALRINRRNVIRDRNDVRRRLLLRIWRLPSVQAAECGFPEHSHALHSDNAFTRREHRRHG